MVTLYNFLKGLGGSTYAGITTQFGSGCYVGTYSCPSTAAFGTNPAGQLQGWWKDTSSVPTTPTQAQLANEAIRAAFHFGDWSTNAQYVIATPTGHGDGSFVAKSGGSCAWHAYTSYNSRYISYTNLPYMADTSSGWANTANSGGLGRLDGVTIVEAHEYAESVTDPFLNGWNDSTKNYGEIGDKCAGTAGYVGNLSLHRHVSRADTVEQLPPLLLWDGLRPQVAR